MQLHAEDKNFSPAPSQLLGSLARELKNPLILMARQAELEAKTTDNPAFESIRHTAEKTLQLIDSYLLMARSEYGQRSLPLQPVGIGSVIYDVANDLRRVSRRRKIEFYTDIKEAHVVGNREGLKVILQCLADLAISDDSISAKMPKQVCIQSRVSRQKVSIAVLSSDMDVNNSDIAAARALQGISYLALGTKLDGSGIRLAIADTLAGALSSSLQVKKSNGLKGLSFELDISEQLQLV